MKWLLSIRNRQRVRAINAALLRRITLSLLRQHLPVSGCALALHLVDADEMTKLNQHFLGHEGSTDVITFDHTQKAEAKEKTNAKKPAGSRPVHGEIFVSVAEAIEQAPAFRTTWQAEIVRYVIHGLLHLLGHDDHQPLARRRMKAVENDLMKRMALAYPLAELARAKTRAAARKT